MAVGELVVERAHMAARSPAGFEHGHTRPRRINSYPQDRPAIPAPMTITFFLTPAFWPASVPASPTALTFNRSRRVLDIPMPDIPVALALLFSSVS